MGLMDWIRGKGEVSEKPKNQILETPTDHEKGKEKLEPADRQKATENFQDKYKIDNKDNHMKNNSTNKLERPDKRTYNNDANNDNSDDVRGGQGRLLEDPWER